MKDGRNNFEESSFSEDKEVAIDSLGDNDELIIE
jgi:hypothetical protein